MPGPEDNILREKDENEEEIEIGAHRGKESAEKDFAQISRLARERDFAELSERRNRALLSEAEYNKKMADYRAAVDQIEGRYGMRIEDIERLHGVAMQYGFRENAFTYALGNVRDERHRFYGVVEPLRNSTEPQEVKEKKYFEGIFALAKKEFPWLENWSVEALIGCYRVQLPQRPVRQDAAGEKSRAAYEAELSEAQKQFAESFNSLHAMMKEYDKANLDPPKTESGKILEKFWDHFWKFNNKTSENDTFGIIDSLRSAMTPKTDPETGETKMSMGDTLLDLFLDYLKEAHKEQDPTKIVPTEEESRILGLVSRCLSATTRYADMLEEAACGTLTVPPQEQEFENGKKIHRVNAVGREPKLTKDFLTKQKNDENTRIEFRDQRYAPLFRFSPKPSDVMQGRLGDCYLLCSLSTIASQNPALLRDAMKDNRDGTVTVRFFTPQKEPVYVTVDKSAPLVNGNDPFARNDGDSLWVQIIEKAYVQSGLKIGALSKAEAGTLESNYDDISGGYEWEAVSAVIGTDYTLFSEENRLIDLPSAKGEGEYTREERRFAEDMKTAIDSGELVTCSYGSTRRAIFGTTLDKKHATVSGIDARETGMHDHHGYSVHSIEEEDGRYYITVRNPHASDGVNSLSDGALTASGRELAQGYSRLELRDFAAYFDSVYVNSVDITAEGIEKAAEAQNIVRHYGDAVRRITEALEGTDGALMYFKNSKQFREFRDAAYALRQTMRSSAPTEKKLNAGLENFFAKAKAYSDYCEGDKKISPFKDSHRAFVRYQAAKIAGQIKSVYEANKGRSLKDEWEEFSWSAAEKKVGVPATSDALLSVYRAAGDSMAGRLVRREGDLSGRETRQKLYRFLKDFAESGSAKELNDGLSAAKNDRERFDCLRKNARTVCTVHFLRAHSGEILRSMRVDGYEVGHTKLAETLLQRASQAPGNAPEKDSFGL